MSGRGRAKVYQQDDADDEGPLDLSLIFKQLGACNRLYHGGCSNPLWAGEIKQLGERFGSPVRSFMGFLRSLWMMNFVTAAMWGITLQIWVALGHQDALFPGLDFAGVVFGLVDGNGMERTWFYYSGYGNLTAPINFAGNISDVPVGASSSAAGGGGGVIMPDTYPTALPLDLVYFTLCTLTFLLLSAALVLRLASFYGPHFDEGVGSFDYKWGKSVLASWDHSVADVDALEDLTNAVGGKITGNLESHNEDLALAAGAHGGKCVLYLRRAVGTLLAGAFVMAFLFIITFLLANEAEVMAAFPLGGGAFAVSGSISAMNALVPPLVKVIIKFEKWEAEVEFKLLLVHVYCMKLMNLFVVFFAAYSVNTDLAAIQASVKLGPGVDGGMSEGAALNMLCWETCFGKLVWKMVVTDMIVNVVGSAVQALLYRLKVRKAMRLVHSVAAELEAADPDNAAGAGGGGGCPPPVGALAPEGWSHNGNGKITEGRPQCKGGQAFFKHSRSLQAKDVLRMRVEVGGFARVGFASEQFNAEKHGETGNSTALMNLSNGTTIINTDISQDGQRHYHQDHLGPHIPEAPFDLALRCEAVSNVPQIQFNDDDVWHDLAPDRAALKAGPWFPYLMLWGAAIRLIDHSVHRPSSDCEEEGTARRAGGGTVGSGHGKGLDTSWKLPPLARQAVATDEEEVPADKGSDSATATFIVDDDDDNDVITTTTSAASADATDPDPERPQPYSSRSTASTFKADYHKRATQRINTECKSEFDTLPILVNTMYQQALVWAGMPYVPFIFCLAFLQLSVNFFVARASLLYRLKPNPKDFTVASDVGFIYSSLLLVTWCASLVPAFVFALTPSGPWCGPFTPSMNSSLALGTPRYLMFDAYLHSVHVPAVYTMVMGVLVAPLFLIMTLCACCACLCVCNARHSQKARMLQKSAETIDEMFYERQALMKEHPEITDEGGVMELVDGKWKGKGLPSEGQCVFVAELTSDFFLWRTGRGRPKVNQVTKKIELALVQNVNGKDSTDFFRSGQPVAEEPEPEPEPEPESDDEPLEGGGDE